MILAKALKGIKTLRTFELKFPKYAGVYSGDDFKTWSFIQKAQYKHNNLYTYDNVTYINNVAKVLITCDIHGDFLVSPKNHLDGKGCPKCSKTTKADFIIKANKVHCTKYFYNNVCYINNKTKVSITCKLHGDFLCTPGHHINSSSGCPSCSGKNHNILYVLNIVGTDIYKVGVTTDTLVRRVTDLQRELQALEGCYELAIVSSKYYEEPKLQETEIHGLDYENPFKNERFQGHTEYRLIPNINPLLKEYF